MHSKYYSASASQVLKIVSSAILLWCSGPYHHHRQDKVLLLKLRAVSVPAPMFGSASTMRTPTSGHRTRLPCPVHKVNLQSWQTTSLRYARVPRCVILVL